MLLMNRSFVDMKALQVSGLPGAGDNSLWARGSALVSDFVCGEDTPQAFATRLAAQGADYGGFNLFVGDATSLWYVSNRGGGPRALARLVAMRDFAEEDLFALLADRTPAEEHELPQTGVGSEMERRLSPIFIEGDAYGTRSSTALRIGEDGRVEMEERRYE